MTLLMFAVLGEAAAQDCSFPFSEHDLRILVEESSEAILREDTLAHKKLVEDFEAQVPCLQAQLPKDAWAQLLVNEALVQNVLGGDWRGAIDTALRIFPSQGGLPGFLMDKYEPLPDPRPAGVAVPDDATLFVDGVLTAVVPEIHGRHVVQVWRDGSFRTTVLVDQPVPLQWLQPKPKEVVEVQVADEGPWQPEGRGGVGVQLGLAVASQLVEEGGTFLGDAQSFGGIAGFASHGMQPVAQNGGVFWDADLPLQLATVRTVAGPAAYRFDGLPVVQPTAYAGAVVVLARAHVGAGAGLFGAQIVEGEQVRGLWFPQPHLTVGARTLRADFEVGGGATFTAAHAGMRGGLVLGSTGDIGWRVGFDVDLTTAWFDEEPPGDRRASLIRTRVLARVGFAWGLAHE